MDLFDDGSALVFDFESIAAYVNRKPQPDKILAPVSVETLKTWRIRMPNRVQTAHDGLEADNDYGPFNWFDC